jgi:polyphenol oxidase
VPASKRPRAKRGQRKSVRPPVATNRWRTHASDGLRILQVSLWREIPWLVHGFSTRPGGVSGVNGKRVLNLAFTEWDPRENVQENRRRFQAALGATDFRLISLLQLHSDAILPFDAVPSAPCRGDASLTDRPGLLLAIQTADCVPVLLVDPRKRAIAAVHAGWRGTLRRLAAKAVGQLQMQFGSQPGNLLAAMGPAIGGCCYEVGTEVTAKFAAQFRNAGEWFDELRTGDEPNALQWLNMAPPGHQPPANRVHLDLRKANHAQLVEAGLLARNIFVSDLCTACRRDLLFSYRKEGALSGRLMSVIGIRSD